MELVVEFDKHHTVKLSDAPPTTCFMSESGILWMKVKSEKSESYTCILNGNIKGTLAFLSDMMINPLECTLTVK